MMIVSPRATLQRGHDFVIVESQPQEARELLEELASTGPRFCDRGELPEDIRSRFTFDQLQRGHDFVIVESASNTRGLGSACQLQRGHDFVIVERHVAQAHDLYHRTASTGPRFCDRGERGVQRY